MCTDLPPEPSGSKPFCLRLLVRRMFGGLDNRAPKIKLWLEIFQLIFISCALAFAALYSDSLLRSREIDARLLELAVAVLSPERPKSDPLRLWAVDMLQASSERSGVSIGPEVAKQLRSGSLNLGSMVQGDPDLVSCLEAFASEIEKMQRWSAGGNYAFFTLPRCFEERLERSISTNPEVAPEIVRLQKRFEKYRHRADSLPAKQP